jgi:hypothetical protein
MSNCSLAIVARWRPREEKKEVKKCYEKPQIQEII